MEVKVKLKRVLDETPDSKSFFFAKPAELTFTAGQFMRWYLPHPSDDRGEVRPFSIITSPTEEDLAFTTKFASPGSSFKRALLDLRPGYEIGVRGPFGHFTLPTDPAVPVVFLGGGVGITPFRSMIKFAVDSKLPTSLTLIYANKTPRDIIYKQEFDRFEEENTNFKAIYTVNTPDGQWKGETGLLTEKMIQRYAAPLDQPLFYICGPAGMIDSYTKILTSLGVAPDRLRTENFSGY